MKKNYENPTFELQLIEVIETNDTTTSLVNTPGVGNDLNDVLPF